ncbi:MAG: hypothetical protein ACP5UN_01225 [Candidatus Micrarchaeia archaeon]
MKYIVNGTFGKSPQKFEFEVEAKSEKHAKMLAIVKLGSNTRVRGGKINIKEIKKI